MAARKALHFRQGVTRHDQLVLEPSPSIGPGNAALMYVTASGSGEPVLELSTADGSLALDPHDMLTICVPHTATAGIPVGHYVHDCELHRDGGTVPRLLEGTVHVAPEVSANGARAPSAAATIS